MPSNLFRKSCLHDKDEYVDQNYKEIFEKGELIELHLGTRKICKVCKAQWGRSRSQKIILKSKYPLNPDKGNGLTIEEVKIYRKIFNELRNGSISELNLINKIKTTQISYDYFIKKMLQENILEKVTIPSFSSHKDNIYFLFSPLAENFLKNQLGILYPEDQQKIILEEISKLFSKEIIIINSYHQKLVEFLKGISKNLINWQEFSIPCSDNTLLKFQININKESLLLYILLSLITWTKIFRTSLTLREVSCRVFTEKKLKIQTDPSKMLGKRNIKEKLKDVIQENLIFTMEEAGLFSEYETVDISGKITAFKEDGKEINFEGSSIILSNLVVHKFCKLKIPSKKLLLVENLAVLAQIALDNWAMENQCTVIYIKGKSTKFLQKVLNLINLSNFDLVIYSWLDYDLGGCQILKIIASIFPEKQIKTILIPNSLNIPYDTFNQKHENQLQQIAAKGSPIICDYAKWILNHGKIEQEFLLSQYSHILKINML
jgi:hypothetical protein